MQPRDTRFWLRFESELRQGERVPLAPGTWSVGRRSDNPIVVAHTSVSGRHAELRVDDEGVTLVDLGSTNGTRVGGERVDERRLAHGDRLSFGGVQLAFEDARLVKGEAAVATGAAGPAAGEGVERVSDDLVRRSASRSKLGPVVLGLLVVLSALVAWRFLAPRAERKATRAAVAPVAGNLLADASFEDLGETVAGAWGSADAAPQAFFRDAGFARSGTAGLGVVLGAGEWAWSRSPELELRPRRSVELVLSLAPEDGAEARAGLELVSSAGAAPTFVAWAPSVVEEGWQEVALGFDLPPAYDRARVVVAARVPAASEGGAVSVDDVSVLQGTTSGPAAVHEEYQAFVLGSPGCTALVVRSGRVLFCGVGLGRWSDQGLEGPGAATWSVAGSEDGLLLSVMGGEPGAALGLLGNARPPLAPDVSGDPLLSSVGPGGYVSHTSSFDRSAVTGLLLGRGVNLLRWGFPEPVAVAGVVRAGVLHFRVAPAPSKVALQLSFDRERVAADQLAARAREAEKDGQAGVAYARWSELLDRYPIDRARIDEAAEARARILQAGHERVEEVRRELERARFFELPDLFRACHALAEETARGYAKTEVGPAAAELAAESAAALEAITLGRHGGRRERLTGVLEALDEAAAPRLAAHVRASLADLEPEQED